jgi:hypothetical protein
MYIEFFFQKPRHLNLLQEIIIASLEILDKLIFLLEGFIIFISDISNLSCAIIFYVPFQKQKTEKDRRSLNGNVRSRLGTGKVRLGEFRLD